MSFAYLIFGIILIIFIIYDIYEMNKFNKKRKDLEVRRLAKKLDGNDGNIVLAFLYAFLSTFYIYFLFKIYSKSYLQLKGEYINNFIQLFDYDYITDLREYFVKNSKVLEIILLNDLTHDFPRYAYWVVFTVSMSVLNFYKGLCDNIIYQDGLFINNKMYSWNEILDFQWSEPYENKIINKGRYYYLTLKLPKNNDLKNDIKVPIGFNEKENVNEILTGFINKDNNIEEIQLNFTPFPNIPTKGLILRRIKTEDKNEIFYLKSNDEILKYLDNEKHKNPEDTENYISRIGEAISKNELIQWGIALNDNSKIIGTICLWNISKERKTAEVGYDLIQEYQGKGIMNEALNAVIKYAFKFIKLDSIYAYTHKDNIKSINLLKRNGFVTVQEENHSGQNIIFKLISTEFRSEIMNNKKKLKSYIKIPNDDI